MAVTMQDIADRAQVSRPVVSLVLGGKSTSRVSEKKRKLILEIVKELDFHPNRQASCLRLGRRDDIGVFLPDWSNVLLLKLIHGLNAEAQKHNFALRYYFGMKQSSYARFIKAMTYSKSSAIISYVPFYSKDSSPDLSEQLQKYIDEGGQVITLNTRHWNMPKCSSVGIDEFHGGLLAAEYLKNKSCASYAAIGYEDSETPGRFNGFTQSLDKKPRWFHFDTQNEMKNLDLELEKLCATCARPVGIFCMNENLPYHILNYLDQKWQRDRDYFLISYEPGFSHTDFLRIPRIVQPFEELGQQAIVQLSRLFYGKSSERLLLKPVLNRPSEQ